jgi:hypothetical protein
MSDNNVAREVLPFWQPPGFRPMSDEAIASLCNGDAPQGVRAQRAATLLIRLKDEKLAPND